MRWVATERRSDLTVVTWIPFIVENTIGSQDILEIEFNRIAIGVNLDPPPYFSVTVGERIIEKRDGRVKLYYCIDECEAPMAQRLFDAMIHQKDQYRCSNVFAPDHPKQLSDSLRRTEGLGFYREDYPRQMGQQIWPSFIDTDCTAGIQLKPVPDENTVHREIEALLSEQARDPETGYPLISKGNPVPRLSLPKDMNVKKARAAIQRADLGPCQALWFVLMGLERSIYIPPKEDNWEPTGNPQTGY